MKTLSIILFIACTFIFFEPCYAIKPYRCNGKVQFRPCEVDSVDTKASKVEGLKTKNVEDKPHPELSDLSFERTSPIEGIWRGHVKGEGLVNLKLFIFRKDLPPIQNEIGTTELFGENIFFAFKSMVPQGTEWTWEIKASSHH